MRSKEEILNERDKLSDVANNPRKYGLVATSQAIRTIEFIDWVLSGQ